MDINLRSCPFCGGEAVFAMNEAVYVVCRNCGAQTENGIYCNDAASICSVAWHAIDAWNRRADDVSDTEID